MQQTRIICILLFMFMLFMPVLSFPQLPPPSYGAEMGTLIQSGTQKPFWLISNRNGKYLPEHSTAFGSFYLVSAPISAEEAYFPAKQDTAKSLHFAYGLEAFNRFNGTYDILLNQYFACIHYWYFNLHVGARSQSFGNQWDPLSSGSLMHSENARPMPKIAISSDYIPVPFLKGYLEFKGYLSHGWFEEDRYTAGPYLHHKNVYVRVGGDLPIHAHYGFHHYAMWGGMSPEYGNIGSDMDSYIKAFMVQSGETIQSEVLNRYGNHLGSRNFGLDYRGKNFSLSLYYQTIFEDNSGKAWRNIKDGLWGVVVHNHAKKALMQHATYEFIHTTDQSGRFHRIGDSIVGGNDNYFNNGVYPSGWSYHGYTLGTPLITSPVMNDNGSIRMLNNKVIAHHLGVKGWLNDKLSYKTLITWSLNYGTNRNSFEPKREDLSLMMELNYLMGEKRQWMVKGKLAGDLGEMYGRNFGVYLGILKRGTFAF